MEIREAITSLNEVRPPQIQAGKGNVYLKKDRFNPLPEAKITMKITGGRMEFTVKHMNNRGEPSGKIEKVDIKKLAKMVRVR